MTKLKDKILARARELNYPAICALIEKDPIIRISDLTQILNEVMAEGEISDADLQVLAEKQYPGRVTMFINPSSAPYLHADEVSELREHTKLEPGRTSTDIENKYLIEAFKTGYRAAKHPQPIRGEVDIATLRYIVERAVDMSTFSDKDIEEMTHEIMQQLKLNPTPRAKEDSGSKKPDGYAVYKGKCLHSFGFEYEDAAVNALVPDGVCCLDYNEGDKHALAELLLAEGFEIRPVKLVFLDEGKCKKE